jgi:hypothetical protein
MTQEGERMGKKWLLVKMRRMQMLKKLEQLFWKQIPNRCHFCLFKDYPFFFQNICEKNDTLQR